MNFAQPHQLWWLLIVIVLSIVFYRVGIHQRKKVERWIHPSLWKSIIPEYSQKTYYWKSLFLCLSMIFLVIALARPQWGEKEETVPTEGLDLFFVVDLSTSMLAEDAAPSRLARAQVFIKKTLQNLSSDRVGVIGFAASPVLSVPLTTDFQYVSEIVDSMDPHSIPSQGTQLSLALEAAMKALERSGEDRNKTSRAVILITDGEDFGADAMAAAKKIKEFGTYFASFHVGTTEGAPIPIRDDSGVLQTYKKDRAGKPVLSKVNPDLLEKISTVAGGKSLALVNADDSAYLLVKQLKALKRGRIEDQRVVTRIDRFILFLIPAFIFLLSFLFTGYRWAAVMFIMIPLAGEANETSSVRSYWEARRGEKSYQNKNFPSAAQSFQSAQKKDTDNPALIFNEATALAQPQDNSTQTPGTPNAPDPQNQKDHAKTAASKFNQATQKALNQGDYELAAKSLFNEGILHAKNKNNAEAFDRLSKAAEIAKLSKQPDLENLAREELARLAISQKEEQKNKSKDQQDKKDEQDNKKNEKKESDPNKSGSENDKGNDPEKKNTDQQNKSGVEPKREYKSGTVSKDVAESIMNDLSDREKQLYQNRNKKEKRPGSANENDW
jgi:Ca-activated chloride channel family protein